MKNTEELEAEKNVKALIEHIRNLKFDISVLEPWEIQYLSQYLINKKDREFIVQSERDAIFKQHLKDAQRIVDAWPEWKKKCLNCLD